MQRSCTNSLGPLNPQKKRNFGIHVLFSLQMLKYIYFRICSRNSCSLLDWPSDKKAKDQRNCSLAQLSRPIWTNHQYAYCMHTWMPLFIYWRRSGRNVEGVSPVLENPVPGTCWDTGGEKKRWTMGSWGTLCGQTNRKWARYNFEPPWNKPTSGTALSTRVSKWNRKPS